MNRVAGRSMVTRRQRENGRLRQIRDARVVAVWRRYCRLRAAEGMPLLDASPGPLAKLPGRLRGVLCDSQRPPAWQFTSVIEASDCGMEHAFRPRPASAPCPCLPGTRGKLDALASRAANGEELWHPDDAKDED